MSPHHDFWYHLTDDQLMVEYIARHKNQDPQLELQELNQRIEYGCSDPRMHPLHQDKAERSSKKQNRGLMTILEISQRYSKITLRNTRSCLTV